MGSTYKSTCDKSVLVVVPQMSSADTASLEMVKDLTKSGYQVTVATTLASREGEALMPELLQFTQDVHVLPHFVRTEDFGHYMLHLVKTRGISAVVLSHSYAGYNFLPFLRASAPTVALVDMVHAKEAFWSPQAFFEDSQGGGYARLSALFSQYLDASVYARAEDKDWTAEEQDKIAQLESTSTTFYSPTKEYSAPERFTADLDAALVAAIAKAQTAVTTNEAVEAARSQVAVIAASIQDNDGSMGSFMHTQNGNRYDLLFLENWDNDRRTGNTTNSTTPSPTTPTPTAAATSGKTIVQAVTFGIVGGVSAYTGNTKTLYERSYGALLGIYSTSSGWAQGNGVDSSAVAGRRTASNVVVTFTATTTAAYAANADAQATALVSSTAALESTITTTKAALGGDFANIATPTVQSVASPTTTTIVSGASQAATTSIVTVAMCMAAMLFRH